MNFIPFVWLSFWDFLFYFFFFPLVYLLPPSFLISQRSPRLFSDDQVPENVEQRACQLAALLEPRPAARHQVTTAPLSMSCLYQWVSVGTAGIWGHTARRAHRNTGTIAAHSPVDKNERASLFCVVFFIRLDSF